MIKILGRREDGILLVDVGSSQAYAVDVVGRRLANLGDKTSPDASSPVWLEVPGKEATEMRWKVQRVLDGPARLVKYEALQPDIKVGPLEDPAPTESIAAQPPPAMTNEPVADPPEAPVPAAAVDTPAAPAAPAPAPPVAVHARVGWVNGVIARLPDTSTTKE